MGKFQMITPIPCEKIYEDDNINKCAKKFYKILKDRNESYRYFTIKNIENDTYYKFRNKRFMSGGNGEQQEQEQEQEEKVKEEIQEEIKEIKKSYENKSNEIILARLDKLEDRIDILENIINKAKEAAKEEVKAVEKEEKIRETKENNSREDKKDSIKEDKIELNKNGNENENENENISEENISEGGKIKKRRGLITPPENEEMCAIQ